METRRHRPAPAQALPSDPSASSAGAPARRRLKGRGPAPLALEQRFMFDGAAVATADAVSKAEPQPSADAAGTAPGPVLNDTARAAWTQAVAQVDQVLAGLPNREDFLQILQQSFGSAGTDAATFAARAGELAAALRNGGPDITVEVRSGAELKGANAAYAAIGSTGAERIYVNGDWLNAGVDSATLQRTLAEEIGHALDQRLNSGADSTGDEGELFSALVMDAGASPEARAAMAADNDHSAVLIDGRAVAVEFSATPEVSVPFYEGFIGTQGSNTGQANNVLNFSTLGISRVSFFQYSATGIFGGTQGNDLSGGLRMTLTSGQVLTITGAINWRVTSQGSLLAFGFIPDPNMTPVSFAYGAGNTFTINGNSNFALEKVGVTYSVADGSNESGNAALNGLLDSLNTYLTEVRAKDPNGPVTVTSQVTNDTTPTLGGTATLAAGESLSVIVNGVAYATSDGLTVDSASNTWSLTVPNGNALANGTYDVTATISNSLGYTLSDTSSAELVVNTALDTAPTITGPGNASGLTSAKTINENTTAVHTFTANESVTWGIMDGEDAAKFSISSSGALVFNTAPDYEAPTDGATGGGNTYIVRIKATDTANNVTYQTVTVTVADVDDTPPTVAITSDKGALKAGDTATLAFTFSEDVGSSFAVGDIAVESGSLSNFTKADATHYTATYTPAANTTDASMGVSVATGTFTDTSDNANTAPAAKSLAVDTAIPAITGPSGNAGDAASAKTIDENTTAVAQLTASEAVTWAIVGGADQAKFSIDAGGNLAFSTAPDYEAPTDVGDTAGNNTYLVQVRATDAAGNASIQTVTVTVANVDDAAVTVTSPTVNENSPYAIFTVTGSAGQSVALALSNGSATGGGTDYGSSGPANLEVSVDGGSNWSSYSGAVTFPAGGSLLVRTPVIDDGIADSGETFTLTATAAADNAATGTATIDDQGGGIIFNPDGTADAGGIPTDDRAVTVNNPVVSEASPFAVFTVSGAAGQRVSLALQSGTATLGVDTAAASLQYFDGAAWADYSGPVALPAGGRLLVRTAVTPDNVYEGAETFTLTATAAGGTPAVGTATLKDDGSSPNVFRNDDTSGNPAAGVADNDAARQTVAITSMTQDTGLSSTDFVTSDGSAGRTVRGTLSAPLGAREVVQVSVDGGSTWQDVPSANIVGDGNGTYAWTAVDHGIHNADWTIRARVYNTDLGLAGQAASQNVVLDSTVARPTVQAQTTVQSQPILAGTFDAADAGGGFSVTVAGRTYTLGTDAALGTDGNTWTLDLGKAGQTLPVGTYDVVARSVDVAGNVSQDASSGELTIAPVPVQQAEPIKLPAVEAKAPAPQPDPAPEQPASGTGRTPAGQVTSSPVSDPMAKPVQDDLAGQGQGSRSAAESLTAPASGATRIAVIKAEEPALMLFHGVPDQNFDSGALVRFQLPADAFVHTQENAVVRITAEKTEGGPLPAWLRFDASTGKFEGKPPADAPREIAIRVTARDADGREASTIFRIKLVAEKNERLTGRPGLSQQIRQAVQRPVQLEKLSRIERIARIQGGKRAA